LDELEGKTFAYVNGSVYYLKVQAVIPNTEEAFYPSIADCVAAVRAGKADAAVQLSFGLQLVENRSDGELALVPGDIAEVEECFFFSHGNPLRDKVDAQIQKFTDDGTIERLREKWVGADEAAKVLPAQDWDAPNGTLRFATPGVLEPYSYVGNGSEVRGFDVDLALLIARELGYHLDISVVPMDSIFAGVEAGKIDFAGTATATPERAQSVDFSMKVMPDHVAAIVRADTAAAVALDAGAVPEYTTVEELAGKTIATQTGSTLGDLLVDTTGVDVTFKYYNQVADEIEAVAL
jgi:polar amino acid transport system substrate-binding protein